MSLYVYGYICMYIYIYVCVCMHVYQVFSFVTNLPHVTEQSLQHCKYDAHSHYVKCAYRLTISPYVYQKHKQLLYLLHMSFLCKCQQMSHICHICQLVHTQIGDNYVSIYASFQLTAINKVTRRPGALLYTHFTSLVYAPQHAYHITNTVQISFKN